LIATLRTLVVLRLIAICDRAEAFFRSRGRGLRQLVGHPKEISGVSIPEGDPQWCDAVHEAGHALVAWASPSVARVTRLVLYRHESVRVRLRGELVAGVCFFEWKPMSERFVLWDDATHRLGGIAAELSRFSRARSGPSRDDLVLARESVSKVMSLAYEPPWTPPPLVGKGVSRMIRGLDPSVAFGLDACYARARHLVDLHRSRLERLAVSLYTYGELEEAQISDLLGPRPWESR
jgi:hypothetical protein